MIIENWIQGKVGFTLTDLNVEAILTDRNVTAGTDVSTLDQSTKELCWADALTIYVTSSNKGSYKIQDGNSAETEGSEYFVDRDEAKSLALYLYGRNGESPITSSDEISNASNLW